MKGIIEVPEGFVFLIDKPLGWTSFDIVKKIRNTLSIKKVGHAGTLDPLASGLMIVCSGKATKQIESFMSTEKEYTGTFFIGATTPSYDLEQEVDATFPIDHITNEQVLETAIGFLGKQEQFPPIFSAIKVDGKRLYKSARAGTEVEIKPRPVEIVEFEITRIELPEVDFRVVVSKGTYIRSLAFDFGKRLESGAYLKSLRRTKSGDFNVDQALSIEEWLPIGRMMAELKAE